ncbi:MAG: response regulator [Parcubacteria group bacterium]|nr:response regulator [Parcubacteria group bacterium]
MSKNKKIVIVEDESVIAEMYQIKFEKSGYQVIKVLDSEKAFETIQKEMPNLIVLDIIMPGFSGFALLKQFKNDEKLKNIPVVILSNLGDPADIDKGKAMGADDYLIKADNTPSQALEKIEKYIK